jgi:Predicted small integral membrane protein
VIDRATSRPAVVVVLVAADAGWVLYSALVGFPSRLELVFQTLVGALTVAMVFVIQHTQARAQEATQRKLDEILSALPHADKTLIALEDATDTELASARATHRGLREEAIERPGPSSSAVTRPAQVEETR